MMAVTGRPVTAAEQNFYKHHYAKSLPIGDFFETGQMPRHEPIP